VRHAWHLLGAACCCIVGGGAAYSATQHVPLTTGLYWAVETASTVGYGDVTPDNPAGRIVALVVMLSTIPLLAACFALFTGQHLADWWHTRHGKRISAELAEIRALAEKAHRISADTHRELTGTEHPDAPGGDA
jgi:voltage-gated potassium channel